MSFRKRVNRAFSDQEVNYRNRYPGKHKHALGHRETSIPLESYDDVDGVDISYSKRAPSPSRMNGLDEDLDETDYRPTATPFNSTADLGDIAKSDSFQQAVAEKTQQLFIGRQEAELEVYIDIIIRQEGDVDRALLHVVSTIEIESRVQLLVNTLLHRGANPSCTNREQKTALHYAAEHGFKGVCAKLLENDAWPNARDVHGNMPFTFAYIQGNDPIASLLLYYMPNAEVRNMYSCFGTKPAEFSFHELLRKDMQKTVLSVLDCMMDPHNNTNHVTVHYQILEADENGRPPTHKEFNGKTKSALQVIAKSGNKTIIYHDVIRLLIRRKWKKYARLRFQINSLFFMVSLVTMTYSVIVAAMSKDPVIYDTPLHIARGVCELISLIVILMVFGSELNQLRKHRLEYFTDAFNWMDMSSTLLLIAVIPLRFTHSTEQWPVYSVGYLLWTMRVTKYAAVFRQTGAYAQILWRILRHDFIQFTMCFAVILLAFSGAFVLSLRGEGPLDDSSSGVHQDVNSFWKILFIGVRILIEAEKIIEYTDLGTMSCILMVLFLFVTCVVLLNILIAQLSDTYQHVQHDAQRGLEVNRAWIVARVELNSNNFIGKDHRTSYYIASEDIRDLARRLERWESPPLNEMNKHIVDIWDSLQSHKLNLLTVNNRLARQENSLRTIQNQLCRIADVVAQEPKNIIENDDDVHIEDIVPTFTDNLQSEPKHDVEGSNPANNDGHSVNFHSGNSDKNSDDDEESKTPAL